MHAFDPDCDVLELCANGDMTGALRRLMQRHGRWVYRYCRRQLRDATLAEDVCQEVFIDAYRDLGGFKGRSKIRTWLFAIARNQVRNAVRSRTRRDGPVVELAESADVSDLRPSPLEVLDEMRLLELVVTRARELSVELRGALLLRYQQGFTFEDMALIYGERPGTLQARVARALQQLRVAVEPQ
jgi:RNA polymerase sigma-70 factor (ECF subfamily)